MTDQIQGAQPSNLKGSPQITSSSRLRRQACRLSHRRTQLNHKNDELLKFVITGEDEAVRVHNVHLDFAWEWNHKSEEEARPNDGR